MLSGARKSIREAVKAELLSMQVDWMNERRGEKRPWWFHYIAHHPQRLFVLIREAVNDPEFPILLGLSTKLKHTFSEKMARPASEKIGPENASVEVLDLNIRALNVLERERIRTIGELCSKTADELLGYNSMGPRTLDEIQTALRFAGLSLRGDGGNSHGR